MRSMLTTLPSDAPSLAEVMKLNEGRQEVLLASIPMATHGDRDVSAFKGYDALVAGYAEAKPKTIIKPMFCALLRRRSDGVLRLVRYGLKRDGLVDDDMTVPHDTRSECYGAFEDHAPATQRLVSNLIEDCRSVEATPDDVKTHDDALAARLKRIMERESMRFLNAARGAAIKRYAGDMTALPRLGADI